MSQPAPPLVSSSPSAVPAITPEQLRELALADQRDQALSGARTLALCNGVGFVVCAVTCLLSALFDAWSLLYALVLGSFGYVELRGRKALLAYDIRAPRMLFRNQLAFCVVVVVYALVQMALVSRSGESLATLLQQHPDLAGALAASDQAELTEQLGQWYQGGMVAFYGLVALLTLIFQGGSAIYYKKRGKQLEQFVNETPAWVIDFRRSRAGTAPGR